MAMLRRSGTGLHIRTDTTPHGRQSTASEGPGLLLLPTHPRVGRRTIVNLVLGDDREYARCRSVALCYLPGGRIAKDGRRCATGEQQRNDDDPIGSFSYLASVPPQPRHYVWVEVWGKTKRKRKSP